MTVVLIGQVRFTPENLEKMRPHIKALVEATNANDGCVFYDIAEDLLDPGLIRFSEEWPDAETLQGHMTAPHIAPYREASTKYGATDRKFTVYEVSGKRPL
jgi:quinol monooxygenase YgiN